MKIKSFAMLSIILFCIFAAVIAVGSAQSRDAKGLTMTLSSMKNSFVIGELVQLNVKFKNDGEKAVYLENVFEIQIAKNKENYLSYYGPTKGISVDGLDTLIKVELNGTYTKSATILWNNKPNVSNMGKYWANQEKSGRILTDYAFNSPGEYFVKIKQRFSDGHPVRDKSAEIVESEPIKVVITEPVGIDLSVWERIKNNGDIAYLMQSGQIRTPKHRTEERLKLKQEAQQLTVEFAGSVYSEQLLTSLSEINKKEVESQKTKDLLERLQKKTPQK